MNEIWKNVLGYEGLYQVSNLGNVKSLNYHRTGKEKILKPGKSGLSKKYLRVNLCKNGIHKGLLVHKIEWEAFYGKVPDGYQVNHIDENPENNRLENLNLMTPKENMNWGSRNLRSAEANTNHPNKSKPVIQYDLEGNVIKEYPSTREIERQLGFDTGNISSCCLGKYKQMYGFVWKYKEVS